MRFVTLTLLSFMVFGCTNMHELNTQENQKPQTYPTFNPNCQRDAPPPPSTAHGFPDFNSPEYQEQQFNKRHCR